MASPTSTVIRYLDRICEWSPDSNIWICRDESLVAQLLNALTRQEYDSVNEIVAGGSIGEVMLDDLKTFIKFEVLQSPTFSMVESEGVDV